MLLPSAKSKKINIRLFPENKEVKNKRKRDDIPGAEEARVLKGTQQALAGHLL
jgi:hypothetical protein